MAVALGQVDVPVRVWLPGRCPRGVRVVVVNVVAVEMLMRQGLVGVFVDMPLTEMQPYPDTHQQAANHETASGRFAQRHDRQHRPQERSG